MGAEMLADSAGKGLGKDNLGKGKGLGKGKALGKGKGKSLLALEDNKDKDENEKPPPPPTEEEELKDAITKKARRARDQTASAQSDLEEALEKAKPSLSRQGKAAAEGWNAELGKVFHSLKECLPGKKKVNSAQVKKLLEEAGKTIKGAKDEAKELRHLANRAPQLPARGPGAEPLEKDSSWGYGQWPWKRQRPWNRHMLYLYSLPTGRGQHLTGAKEKGNARLAWLGRGNNLHVEMCVCVCVYVGR